MKILGGLEISDNPLSLRQHKLGRRILPDCPENYTTIYIIEHPEGPVYKIGISKNVEARLTQLRKQYGAIKTVHLIYTVDRDAERELHRIFKFKRVKLPGRNSREWFLLEDYDIEWLKTLTYVGPKEMAQDFLLGVRLMLTGYLPLEN